MRIDWLHTLDEVFSIVLQQFTVVAPESVRDLPFILKNRKQIVNSTKFFMPISKKHQAILKNKTKKEIAWAHRYVISTSFELLRMLSTPRFRKYKYTFIAVNKTLHIATLMDPIAFDLIPSATTTRELFARTQNMHGLCKSSFFENCYGIGPQIRMEIQMQPSPHHRNVRHFEACFKSVTLRALNFGPLSRLRRRQTYEELECSCIPNMTVGLDSLKGESAFATVLLREDVFLEACLIEKMKPCRVLCFQDIKQLLEEGTAPLLFVQARVVCKFAVYECVEDEVQDIRLQWLLESAGITLVDNEC
jgi:hypothetical protein